MPKNTVTEFVAESFTNKIGQVIQPGDRVAYVTNGRHRIRQGTGWFDGVMKDRRSGNVEFTRIRGIRSTKTVATGKMLTHSYTSYTWRNEVKTYEYPEYIEVQVDPHGTTCLQCHRIFKI